MKDFSIAGWAAGSGRRVGGGSSAAREEMAVGKPRTKHRHRRVNILNASFPACRSTQIISFPPAPQTPVEASAQWRQRVCCIRHANAPVHVRERPGREAAAGELPDPWAPSRGSHSGGRTTPKTAGSGCEPDSTQSGGGCFARSRFCIEVLSRCPLEAIGRSLSVFGNAFRDQARRYQKAKVEVKNGSRIACRLDCWLAATRSRTGARPATFFCAPRVISPDTPLASCPSGATAKRDVKPALT